MATPVELSTIGNRGWKQSGTHSSEWQSYGLPTVWERETGDSRWWKNSFRGRKGVTQWSSWSQQRRGGTEGCRNSVEEQDQVATTGSRAGIEVRNRDRSDKRVGGRVAKQERDESSEIPCVLGCPLVTENRLGSENLPSVVDKDD